MNLSKVFVVDIECDGLLENLTKLHILSLGWKSPTGDWKIKSTNKEEDIAKIFSNPDNTIVGHFFLGYDVKAIKKLFPNIEVKAQIIDTLSLSHYLYNERPTHGLESWGKDLGFDKVEISPEEWENLTYEKAKERCEGDVNINILLWEKMLKLLRGLYATDEEILPVIRRANFKIELQSIQSENKILVDIVQCQKNLDFLQEIIDKKVKEVEAIMPGVPNIQIINKPAKLTKKDNSPSAAAIKWFSLLKENGVREDYEGTLELVKSYDAPNVSSSKQMKEFLFSKGWKPLLFKPGANGDVPQLRDDNKNLCKSILKLVKDFPELEALQGLSVAQHRSGYLKAFLECADEEGYITASWSGMAKTWRVKHVKPIVNLPGNNSQYGELIRSVIIAPKGKLFVNADLSSLEDKTKQVCISPLDPEYVQTMNTKGYDAHLNIGLSAGFLIQEEADFFKWYKNDNRDVKDLPEIFKGHSEEELSAAFKKVSKIRASAKTVNYACLPIDNTEVLTRDGWKSYDELSIGEDVMTYNVGKDATEFSPIQHKIFIEDSEVVRMSNKWWNMESTADHRWYGKVRTGRGPTKRYENKFFTTEEVKTEFNILNSAKYIGGDLNITEDEASFLGWLLSDGSYKWADKSNGRSTSNGTKRGVKLCLTQSKKKFYIEIEELLSRIGAPYSVITNNSNTEVFTIGSAFSREFLDKLFKERVGKREADWVNLVLRMSPSCLESFFLSFFKGDGLLGEKSASKIISQNKGNVSEGIKLAGFLLGYRVTSSGNFCEDINFSVVNYTSGQRIKKEVSRRSDVFCLTTENSTFVIKQNGLVSITGNCTYGASAKKISEAAEISLKEAKTLHETYWKVNWSVKKFAESLEVKEVDGRNWIYSPYSKTWLLLTSDHIKFSAVNQNFGTAVFDLFLWFLVKAGVKPIMTIHDELSFYSDEGTEEEVRQIIQTSMDKVNKAFNFPIKFESGPEFATSYGAVH